MNFTFSDYQESADFLRGRLNGFVPEVLLILGSGLGFLGDKVDSPVFVDYGAIPHFRPSTAPDHKGRFVFGTLRGRRVAVMQGRMHCYEGYSMEDAAYAVRVLRLLGAGKLIVTNAAGAVNTAFSAGDLMLITDHINFARVNPLIGENDDAYGTRFPDQSNVYDRNLRQKVLELAKAADIPLRQGVYMMFSGPCFETPAEIRMARTLGASAVGMSTVPEAIAASHCGIQTLGISLITNMAAGILDQPLTHDEVQQAAAEASARFGALVDMIIERVF